MELLRGHTTGTRDEVADGFAITLLHRLQLLSKQFTTLRTTITQITEQVTAQT